MQWGLTGESDAWERELLIGPDGSEVTSWSEKGRHLEGQSHQHCIPWGGELPKVSRRKGDGGSYGPFVSHKNWYETVTPNVIVSGGGALGR